MRIFAKHRAQAEDYLWYRYGYGSYDLNNGRAADHSVTALRASCSDTALQGKLVLYLDAKFKLHQIDCNRP